MSRAEKVQAITGDAITLKERLDKALKVAQAGASLLPEETIAPPPKEEEIVPQLSDVIPDAALRLKLIRMLKEQMPWQQQEAAAKKARKPLTAAIKKILGQFQVGKAAWDGHIINYFASKPRRSVNEAKLIIALTGVGLQPRQIQTVLNTCVEVGSPSYTLRIITEGEKEEEE